VIKGVPLVHRGEVWLVSSQLKARLLRERSSYKSAIFGPILELFCRHAVLKPLALTVGEIYTVFCFTRSAIARCIHTAYAA
jgi:hypothetical protein